MQKWFNLSLTAMADIRCKQLFYLFGFILLLGSCTSNTPDNIPPPTVKPEKLNYQFYTVEIKDMKFVPDTITVKKGDKIVFVNRDMVNHCVTEEQHKAWTSGPISSGQSYILAPTESADYYCAIHTVMKGKIIVQ